MAVCWLHNANPHTKAPRYIEPRVRSLLMRTVWYSIQHIRKLLSANTSAVIAYCQISREHATIPCIDNKCTFVVRPTANQKARQLNDPNVKNPPTTHSLT